MSGASPPRGLRARAPRARIGALDERGTPQWLDAWRPSPHLADRGLEAQDDDAVVTARVRMRGQTWLAAAQDERFLAGSVGAEHAKALGALFTRAIAERPDGVVLLAASAGVRLHEANAAELELARALRALLDARAAGIPTAAIAVGDVFGGASVLACAMDRLSTVPGVRLGLSGPKVIEAARGRDELDASDVHAVDALYGAAARVRAGLADEVADDPAAVATWLLRAPRPRAFAESVVEAVERAAAGSSDGMPGSPLDDAWNARRVAASLWRATDTWIVAPFTGRAVDADALHALDAALLRHVGGNEGPRRLLLLEDSPGHAVGRAAEAGFLSRELAMHAAVLTVLRHRGVRLVGALTGTGHSAAFFCNALQADVLCATPRARVIAMDPAAIARVTGVNAAHLIEHDRLMGQPARHLAALGGVAELLADDSARSVLAFAARAG
jgi:biotin-independent malonate decarboxylase beta subunit